jgi:serine/threonine protein phosphatase PrpC
MTAASDNAGLAMSRCIGDMDLKPFGVSAIPIVKKFSLKRDQIEHIVLASDGVWEVLSNE